jgi:hypothetical protein
MNESPDEIRKNIEILSEFETEYRLFVHAVEEGQQGRSYWHPQAFAQRKRDILEAAPRANLAVRASGLQVSVEKFGPDGRKRSITHLEDLVMDFDEGDRGLAVPRRLLDALPRQIGALRVKLEKTESGQSSPRAATPTASTYAALSSGQKEGRRSWINHPWTITIVGGVVAAVVAGLIVALILSA